VRLRPLTAQIRVFTIIASVVLVLGSCDFFFGSDGGGAPGGGGGGAPGGTDSPVGDWSSASWTEHGSLNGSASLPVSGAYAGADLFYVLTNSSQSDAQTALPAANIVGGAAAGADRFMVLINGEGDLEYLPVGDVVAQSTADRTPIAQRGHPRITAANRELATRFSTGTVSALADVGTVAAGGDYAVGDTGEMIAWAELEADLDDDESVTTAAVPVNVTLEAKQSQGEWDFYIWIVNSMVSGYEAYDELAWDYADDTDLSTANIGAMAQIFLDNAVDDDVFDLVTNAFGDPWGPHPYSNLVEGTERNVHVLLYDIDGDRLPGAGDARIVGFFYGLDNFTDEDGNSLVMFHLDAALFGAQDIEPADGWQITDYWPAQVVSTLAHEFQHMIHFYQRSIVPADGSADGSYETWMDEANSMMAEDLVAQAIENNGPRGVSYTDGSAGSPGISSGRIPDYIGYGSETQLTNWYSSDDVLDQYGVSYAFGAYLGRAFGAGFFTDLMDNATATGTTGLEYTSVAIAEAASAASGEPLDFDELLRRWGVAYLVSNDTAVPAQYRINRGGWFTSSTGGVNYQLGSINAYNYVLYGGGGSVIANGIMAYNAVSGAVPVAGGANSFVVAGTVPAGGYTVSVSLPADTTLTVLTR